MSKSDERRLREQGAGARPGGALPSHRPAPALAEPPPAKLARLAAPEERDPQAAWSAGSGAAAFDLVSVGGELIGAVEAVDGDEEWPSDAE